MKIQNTNLLGKNISFLRKQKGWNQTVLGKKLDLNRANIGSYEEGRAMPKAFQLLRISEMFEVPIEDLLEKDLSKEPSTGIRRYPRPEDGIIFIPEKAAAGYTEGFSDMSYLEEQDRIYLPGVKGNGYRAFEIKGDSMLPLTPSGTIVVGERVLNLNELKSGAPCVVKMREDGLVFKYVYPGNDQHGERFVTLVSANRSYQPYDIPAEDIHEIWKAVRYVINPN